MDARTTGPRRGRMFGLAQWSHYWRCSSRRRRGSARAHVTSSRDGRLLRQLHHQGGRDVYGGVHLIVTLGGHTIYDTAEKRQRHVVDHSGPAGTLDITDIGTVGEPSTLGRVTAPREWRHRLAHRSSHELQGQPNY